MSNVLPETFRFSTVSLERVTVALVGELDLDTAPELDEELSVIAINGIQHLTVDLSELTFIGSTGLATLIRAFERLESKAPAWLCGTRTATPARFTRSVASARCSP